MIDEEVRKMVASQFERAKQLLTEKREELEILANALLEREVIVKSDLETLIGPRPYPEPEKVRLAEKFVVEPEAEDELAVSESSPSPEESEES